MSITDILLLLLLEGSVKGISFYTSSVFFVLFGILSVYGIWHLLKKAGKKPWHSLVPGLRYIDLFEISWQKKYSYIYILAWGAYLLIRPAGGQLLSAGPRGIAAFVLLIISVAVSGVMKIKLAKSFSRDVITGLGLIVMEDLFFFLLGIGNSTYLGPTLLKYNIQEKEVKQRGHSSSERTTQRQYLLNLSKKRSQTALIASIIVFFCSLWAVRGGLLENPSSATPERGETLFHLFTVNSNVIAAVSAAFIIPYAVEGIRNKRFTLPKWVSIIQYSGVICTTLTMLFAIVLIFPYLGPSVAFGGMNFWLHLVCPIMALILFYSVESNQKFLAGDSIIALIPFYCYAAAYIFNVVFKGIEHGGWRDIYRLIKFAPAVVTGPMMFLLGFGIAALLRYSYNSLSQKRHEKALALWDRSLDPVEVKIEVFGLGRYKGHHSDVDTITIPMDIFLDIHEVYGIPVNELIPVYSRGVIDGLCERSESLNTLRKKSDTLFGTPQKLAAARSDTADNSESA